MVILTPTNGQEFSAPADVPIQVSVSDSNSFVHLVSFYEGTNLIATLVLDPIVGELNGETNQLLSYTWSPVPPGNYTLTVVGTDTQGLSGTSAPVNITVGPLPPPLANIIIPTNDEVILGPTNVLILADGYQPGGFVESMAFYAGTNLLGIASNNPIVLDPPETAAPGPIVYPLFPFHLIWSNALPGAYTLTAVAMNYQGQTGTSAPVNITIVTNLPPPTNIPPIVKIDRPTNGEIFYANPNIQICASALDPDGRVTTVQFFAGTNSIGIVTNYPIVVPVDLQVGLPPYDLYCLTWSNVPPGAYVLTAVATDNGGAMSTSAPVDITVTTNAPPPPTNIPPVVAIVSPPDGAVFISPADILIYADAFDPDGFVRTVQFFENGTNLGTVTNNPIVATPLAGAPTANGSVIYPGNPFHWLWTNVTAGEYTLTAVATDNGGAMTTSAPVHINVVSPSNAPPVVTIYATDPIAVAGTNYYCCPPPAAFANYCTGTNTATFLVRRTGPDGSSLVVDYAIGGTASNGVDYAALPGYVMIPAGQDYGLVTIVPLDNTNISATPIKTVILTLVETPTATNPPPYIVGWPGKAEAIIIEDRCMPGPVTGILPDKTFHVCMSGTNGASYSVQVSADLIDWTPVCTNVVTKGAIIFLDPETGSYTSRFYRVGPAGIPAY